MAEFESSADSGTPTPSSRREGVARWVSIGLLSATGLILVWAMISAVSYTVAHTSPPCSNPPRLDSDPPQLAVVSLGLMAFALGHLTARWQAVDPKHVRRRTRASSIPPENDRRRRDALVIQALLLAFLLEMLGLLIIEIVTLSRGVWPITFYVRCAYDAAGWQSTLAAAAVLFLVGRWFWLPRRRWHARTGS